MKINDVIDYNPELESGAMSKLLPLKEAVSRHVKPGMKLHLAGGIGGPSAAICEIIRQYHGKRPDFTLIQSTVTGHAINLLYCNLIKKMIFSACMDLTTSGRPSRVMQKAWEEKSVEFENWSLCSLQQRLMAGAMGVSFMPTRSIAGSNMALDNRGAFQEIDDPFGSDAKIGLVQAINPDISIVHGCVADELGNTILSIPYGDDLWGALASSQGVLVTVEKIVPTDFIREHAALVKIPGYIVNAVSVAPMGLHPFLMVDPGINDLDAYETDTEFLQELHKAFAEDRTLDAWIKEWVIDCATQEDYLNKLGSRRIIALKKITVDELLDACAHDFEGNGREQIREMLLAAPKYGNDEDEPDEMMKRKLINETSLHFFERGCQRLHAGDLNEAANSFCKAVEESPKFLDAYTNWGGCLLDLGKPKEALSVLHKGQEIGMTLDLGNNIDRAKAMLRKENE